MEKPPGYAAFATDLGNPETGDKGLWSSEELFNAAKVVEELERHPGWAILGDLLDQRRQRIEEQLTLTGHVFEQGQYARQHGILAGLRMARDGARAIRYSAQEWERNMPQLAAAAERE